jgi:hypothetical protein
MPNDRLLTFWPVAMAVSGGGGVAHRKSAA